MRDFKVGDVVVCILKERPSYFNSRGYMDYLLDAKSKVVIVSVSSREVSIRNTNPDVDANTWMLKKNDIRLVRYPTVEGDEL